MFSATLDAALLAKMFLAGAKNLDAKKEWINELNVFPVPDGDTGTNMSMTIMSAAREVSALEEADMHALAKAIASGSLRGARGNSGVILSQLFRGFTKAIDHKENIDKAVLCNAIEKACETAYKAVMKPKEGTILTVARGVADKAIELAFDKHYDMKSYLKALLLEGEAVLAKTPEMLPVLKQAGVVDSGGQGLIEVLRGAYDAYLGKEIDYTIEGAQKSASGVVKISAQTEEEIKFGYCTEFIFVLNKTFSQEDEKEMKEFLESKGDSIVLVADDEIVKIHVHTNDPGLVLQKALTYGSLSRIKIDNMREEHQEKLIKDAEKLAAQQAEEAAKEPPKEMGFISVSMGEGLKKLAAQQAEEAAKEPPKEMGFISVSMGEGLTEAFKGLGVDYIIEGGQTMNPSTEDMLNAIDRVNAKTIFILPNNKNIILAAQQAADLTDDKQIIVVPTKTVPQGITAMINFIAEQSPEENLETMKEAISMVKTGQVTYAVRDTVIDDKEIREGDYMGIGDSSILAVGADMDTVLKDLLAELVDEDSSFISIYYGEGVLKEAANAFASYVEETYPDCELDLTYGGQPIYYYVLSVE